MVTSESTDPLLDELSAAALWAAAADGMLLVDAEGRVLAANGAACQLFGRDADGLVGRPVEELVPPELRGAHVALRSRYEEQPESRPMASSRMLDGVRGDGSRFPINVSLGRLDLRNHGEVTLASVRDLTERVAAETQAVEADRLRAIAEDHDRIASDLHDTVIQRLFALGLGVQGLAGATQDRHLGERLSEAVDSIDEIIGEIRSTIFGLRRPPAATVAPLRQLVLLTVAEAEVPLGFTPEVRFVGPVDSLDSPAIAEQLVPVVREALSNVARHAQATTAVVTLRASEGRLCLDVVDDGVGIQEPSHRSGLLNLAERAIALGGRFEVERVVPGSGTRLSWTVPTPAVG